MTRIWKLATGISSLVAAALLAAPASTQPASYSWTGFYLGAHAGYGWSPGSTTLDAVIFGVPTPWYVALDSTELADHHRIRSDGFLGGIQTGYLFQSGSMVLGIEADVSYSALRGHLNKSGSITGGSPPTTSTYIFDLWHELQWLTTLRGRVGVAQDNGLQLFATGGLAVGGVKNAMMLEFTSIGGTDYYGTKSSARAGWAAGAGAEYRVSETLSTKFEYLYYDLGKTTVTAIDIAQSSNPFQVRAHVRNAGHIIRFGLNYRFK